MEGTATRTESLLRPREIQVRIRSGQSPETVAAAAQTTVDRVMAFATPVLAERAFVAQQAAKASVRRRAGDGPVGTLGDAVARRLESAGLDPDSADWDAWRREDGRWTVVTAYAEAGESRRGEFTYDAMGRYVVAEDDTARWLVGERRAVDPAPSGVPRVDDPGSAQLALGDDALRVVTGQPLSPVATLAPVDGPAAERTPVPAGPAAEDPTEDLTETARAVRAVAAAPVDAAPVDPAPVDPAAPPGAAPVDAVAADAEGLFEDAALRKRPDPAERRPSRPATQSSTRPRTRRSMPSWDDIVLGSAPRAD